MPTVAVTQTPLLGVNGSGQLKVNTENMPKVSDPIVPDDSKYTEHARNVVASFPNIVFLGSKYKNRLTDMIHKASWVLLCCFKKNDT